MAIKHLIKHLSAVACLALLLTSCVRQLPSSGAGTSGASVTAGTSATASTSSQSADPINPIYGTVPRSAGPAAIGDNTGFEWNWDSSSVSIPNHPAQQDAANQFISDMQTAYPDGTPLNYNMYYSLLNLVFISVDAADSSAPPVTKTIVLNADGQALSFADLFYSDVDVLAYINERIAYNGIDEDSQKRAFTGYTALPGAFFTGEGQVSVWLDGSDPFFTNTILTIFLFPQVSPYGEDYVDVSWQDTGIPFAYDKEYPAAAVPSTLLIPSVRFDNGAAPEKDAAANAAIQAMVPALQQAGFSAFPSVHVFDGCLSVVYPERATGYTAAVPGGALLWDIGAGKPTDIPVIVAAHQWKYALLTGALHDYLSGETADTMWDFPAIEGYVPPAGSVYGDIYKEDSLQYYLTLTQPDGQRLLMMQVPGT